MSYHDKLKHSYFLATKFSGLQKIKRFQNRKFSLTLTYHGVLPELGDVDVKFENRNFVSLKQFDKQIEILLRYFIPIQLEDLTDAPEQAAGGFLITFDDGFMNNYKYALPILKKYDLSAVFFITTGLVGTRNLLWTEQVSRLLARTSRKTLKIFVDREYEFELDGSNLRDAVSTELRTLMKRLPRDRRDTVLAQLYRQCVDVNPNLEYDEEDRYLFMDHEQIKKMIKHGQVIGSHTHTHSILSTLSEQDSMLELDKSKQLLEQWTDRQCKTLSYPNGAISDYGTIQKEQLKKLDYRCAFTQIPRYNSKKIGLYDLHRLNITAKMNPAVFEAKISGI